MRENFKVLLIAHDWAGFKKGDVYVCRDNEYYRSNDMYDKRFHKDLLSIDNPNLDFKAFQNAELFVKDKLGIDGDLLNVFTHLCDTLNDFAIITCYVSKVIKVYKSLAG